MINLISFVGVDESTDLLKLNDLRNNSDALVECGVLYSPNKSGTLTNKRYPSLQFIKDFPNKFHGLTSLHLCGSSVQNFFNKREIFDISKHFSRIQLNFSIKEFTETTIIKQLIDLRDYQEDGELGDIIIQHNKSKAKLIDILCKSDDIANINILFDASGGLGKVMNDPQSCSNFNRYCGYAGGINPDNIDSIIKKLQAVNSDNDLNYYIDMESGIRTNDLFDIDKCSHIINSVNSLHYGGEL